MASMRLSGAAFQLVLGLWLLHAQPLLAGSGKADVFEITTYKLKAGTSVEEGRKLASELNTAYKKQKGFEGREVYFDTEQKVWVERVKWKHEAAAHEGRDAVNKDPSVQKFESMLERDGYQRIRGERLFKFEI